MSEQLYISKNIPKSEMYRELLPQIEALIDYETDVTANLANIAAALKSTFNHFWVGFYIVKGEELVLGPFQGPIACTRIKFGNGVCGTAWAGGETVVVENVDEFPGHIACSTESKSEIVVPIFKDGAVAMVLDVDSDELSMFDDVDKSNLEKLAHVIANRL